MSELIPPVVARLKGDISDFRAKMGEVPGVMDEVQKKTTSRGQAIASGVGKALVGVGATATAVGATLLHFAEPAEQAEAQLKVAVENTGQSYEAQKGHLEHVADSMAKYGHNSADALTALTTLTAGTNSTATATSLMGEAADLAARKHESLATAAQSLVKIYAGKGGRALAEFGIALTTTGSGAKQLDAAQKQAETSATALAKAHERLAVLQAQDAHLKKGSIAAFVALKQAQENVVLATDKHNQALKNLADVQERTKNGTEGGTQALALLEGKLKGSAAAAADTFGGKIAALRAHVENVAASIGQKLGPALTLAGPPLMGIGAIIESGVIPKLMTLAVDTAETAARMAINFAMMAADAIAWAATMVASALAAAAPFLPFIAAAVAVGVAAYELYTHWKEVWGFIKAIIDDAWKWIKQHLDLIIAVALGPLGIAIDLLKDHWQTVWNAIKAVTEAVWNAIRTVITTAWEAIKTVITTELEILKTVWSTGWNAVKAVTSTVAGAIKAVITDLVNGGIAIVTAAVQTLQTVWSTAWSTVKFVMAAAWSAVQGPLNMIHGAIQAIVNVINDIVGAAEHAGSAIAHIADHLPGAGIVKGALGAIGLAEGAIVDRPTLAVIGEAGREAVIPLDQFTGGGVSPIPDFQPSAATVAAAGGGTTVVIQGNVYGGDPGLQELSSLLERQYQRTSQRNSLTFLQPRSSG